MPKGCPFAPRCDSAMKICLRERCRRMEINSDHAAACWMNVKEINIIPLTIRNSNYFNTTIKYFFKQLFNITIIKINS